MKLITAIIQEDKLDEVREALIAAEIGRITVIRVDGHGRQEDTEIYRGLVVVPNLIPKVEIKIAVNEEFVDITVDTLAINGSSTFAGTNPLTNAAMEAMMAVAPNTGLAADPAAGTNFFSTFQSWLRRKT